MTQFTPPAPDYELVAATEKGFLVRAALDPSDYLSRLQYVSSPLD